VLDYYADFTTEIDEELADNVAAADEIERRGGGAKASWRGEATARRPSLPPRGTTAHGCGYDVVAAADFPDLTTLSDEELLRRASVEERAIGTENAKDFDRIVRSWVATGEHHAGVVFTSLDASTVVVSPTRRTSLRH